MSFFNMNDAISANSSNKSEDACLEDALQCLACVKALEKQMEERGLADEKIAVDLPF